MVDVDDQPGAIGLDGVTDRLNRALREWLEERTRAYVLTVSGKASVGRADRPWPVKTRLAMVEEEGWCR